MSVIIHPVGTRALLIEVDSLAQVMDWHAALSLSLIHI